MVFCPVCNQEREIKDDGTCMQCDSNLNPLVRWKGMPEEYFIKAAKLRDEGDVDGAIEKLIVALNINPSFVRGYIELAHLYMARSFYDRAATYYANALRLDPDNISAKEGLASIQEKNNRVAKEKKVGRIYTVARMSASFIAGICLLFIIQSLVSSSIFQQTPPKPNRDKIITENTATKNNKTVTSGRSKTLYAVRKGDSLAGIAAKKYGSASLWHHIYELNKEKIKNPDILMIGEVLELSEIRVTPK